MDDPVGIDGEGHFDLRNPAKGAADPVETEFAEGLVGGSDLPLSLEDVDLHAGLEIGRGGEDLGVLAGQGRIAVDDSREDVAEGFDAQGQRCDIQQKNILYIAL